MSEFGAGFLQCPGYKCKECIDDSWAEIIFAEETNIKGTDPDSGNINTMLSKFHENKVKRIVDRQSSLTWCPISDCGCIVILPKSSQQRGKFFEFM